MAAGKPVKAYLTIDTRHNRNNDKSVPGALLTIYSEQSGDIIPITAEQPVFNVRSHGNRRYTFTCDSVNTGKVIWQAELTDRRNPDIILDNASQETYVREMGGECDDQIEEYDDD